MALERAEEAPDKGWESWIRTSAQLLLSKEFGQVTSYIQALLPSLLEGKSPTGAPG